MNHDSLRCTQSTGRRTRTYGFVCQSPLTLVMSRLEILLETRYIELNFDKSEK